MTHKVILVQEDDGLIILFFALISKAKASYYNRIDSRIRATIMKLLEMEHTIKNMTMFIMFHSNLLE